MQCHTVNRSVAMETIPSKLENNGSILLPNYTGMFNFESNFNHIESIKWMQQNWETSLYFVGIYLLIIFTSQFYMQNRTRFALKKPLMIWNLMLAIFSIFGAIRTVPELGFILNRPNGFHDSVCYPSWGQNQAWHLWTFLFVTSKAVELGDTFFIILRKQRLIFLHWYHHITVLIYSWYSYGEVIAPARWYVTTNYVIHSFMYSYYFLRAIRVRIPTLIAICITSLQLVQMVIGVSVNTHAYLSKSRGEACDVSEHNIRLSLLMYSSYFILFAQFFYKAYVGKSNIQVNCKAD